MTVFGNLHYTESVIGGALVIVLALVLFAVLVLWLLKARVDLRAAKRRDDAARVAQEAAGVLQADVAQDHARRMARRSSLGR